MTRTQLRAIFGETVNLTDPDVRRRIYAALSSECPTHDPVRFPGGTSIPTPPARLLADMIRALPA